MKKTFLFIALIGASCQAMFAQDAVQPAAKSKIFEHRVGVQANELIRQVFNFNNNANSNLTNPYLLIYSLNFKKSGWGIRTGVGYTKRTISDDNGVTSVETNIDELKSRLGFEKAFTLSDKWSTGVGIDLTYNNANNKTTSVVTGFDSSSIITKSLVSSYGGGPMGWLRYHITDRILIGTEASIYYTTGFEKKTVIITTTDFNGPGPFPVPEKTTTTTYTDNKLSDVNINLPVAIYLIVKF